MSRRPAAWFALALSTLASLAVVGTPVWLIQPFAAQTQAGVEWSWLLRRAAPLVTLLAAFVSVALATTLWRTPSGHDGATRRARTARRFATRFALVALVSVGFGAAWFARQNHFEWMFRPFPDPRFVAAADASDVPPEEPVIGVARDGVALAFPITRIGYHHLVNATLGDVPIVATY